MNILLLTELRAIMALLETMPSVPMPAPVLPVSVSIPDESYLELPYDDEGVKRFLDYGWEEIGDWCSPQYPFALRFHLLQHVFDHPKILAGHRPGGDSGAGIRCQGSRGLPAIGH